MNALNVHGGGAELESTSGRLGLCGAYNPSVASSLSSSIATLLSLVGVTSSIEVVSSSSASQSETMADDRGEVSGEGVERKCNVGLDSGLFRIMARFQSRILEPVRSIAPAFRLIDRLRPGV